MSSLELRIPPPVLFLLCASVMWWLSAKEAPLLWQNVLLVLLGIVGAILGVAALQRFHRHQTTVSPVHLHKSHHLVTGGVYRFSRNPMYLGLFCWLAGWACYLGGVWVWLGPLSLLVWLTRFQIIPEERLLQARFRDEYTRYCQQVRRWC